MRCQARPVDFAGLGGGRSGMVVFYHHKAAIEQGRAMVNVR
jgi:hypothetical protein